MASLEEVVFQGLGEASMCWSETPKGVFDSNRAKRIGDEIMQAIQDCQRCNRIEEALDHVDDCMDALGISLNLLDPDGTFKRMPSEEVLLKIMQAVGEDFRRLSDAIHEA